MIVLGTVLLNATTARPLAYLLKVVLDASEGILIMGCNTASRLLAKYLQDNKRHVVLIDNNSSSVRRAQEMGLEAFTVNVYTEDLSEHFELLDMGYMIAMTSSLDVNQYICQKYENIFGENGTFRLISPEEMKKSPEELKNMDLFSYTDDFLNFNEAARDYPHIWEVPITSRSEMLNLLEKISYLEKSIPLFIKDNEGELHFIPSVIDTIEVVEGFYLVYMGKDIEQGKIDPSSKIRQIDKA